MLMELTENHDTLYVCFIICKNMTLTKLIYVITIHVMTFVSHYSKCFSIHFTLKQIVIHKVNRANTTK